MGAADDFRRRTGGIPAKESGLSDVWDFTKTIFVETFSRVKAWASPNYNIMKFSARFALYLVKLGLRLVVVSRLTKSQF